MPPKGRSLAELKHVKIGDMTGEEYERFNAASKKGDRGVLGTLFLATKGKLVSTAQDITEMAEQEEKRQEFEREMQKDLKELVSEMKAQRGIKS